MKHFICFFSVLLLFQSPQAQNIANLSYPEIDSLLYLYEYDFPKHDKGLQLALTASQKSGKEDSLCAEYSEWAAYFYEEKGDNEEALKCYQKSLNIFSKTLGINSYRYATTLDFLGNFYDIKLGNYEKALSLLIQSKKIKEKIIGDTHPDYASSLNSIAYLHQEMENYDKAFPLLLQAKNIIEKRLGKKTNPSPVL